MRDARRSMGAGGGERKRRWLQPALRGSIPSRRDEDVDLVMAAVAVAGGGSSLASTGAAPPSMVFPAPS
jgi:hypothetical protein